MTWWLDMLLQAVSAMAGVAIVLIAADVYRPAPPKRPPRTLTDRQLRLLHEADKHDDRRYDLLRRDCPVSAEKHAERARMLRQEAAQLKEVPPPCPDANGTGGYR